MYEKLPAIAVGSRSDLSLGWNEIGQALALRLARPGSVLCVECYPGVFVDEVMEALTSRLKPTLTLRSQALFKRPTAIDAMLEPYLGGDDPVFGRMNGVELADFFDPTALADAKTRLAQVKGLTLVVGVGASLVSESPDVMVLADLARWEIQQRQRRHEVGNLGVDNAAERPSVLYKRAFFIDWRAADRRKKRLLPTVDFLLDTNDRRKPKLISGRVLRGGLARAAAQPFRVVPFFDPGPWGGQWMKEVCDLPREAVNYAWCFDCVPEENSLLLGFGELRVEVPSQNLVFSHPRELLGDAVHARFGTEFPIRFDFLDTMQGGNLSLQVHPLTEYIQDRFGVAYTQDESYYLLDASPEGTVYLGLKNGVEAERMLGDLRRAQLDAAAPFADPLYVNRWPAKKHDHFLIPAGTVHGAGAGSMVLEISATPYIFTFKLWDWGRLGLDGRPRPIHLEHGAANIQWSRTTDWVGQHLVNRIEPIGQGDGWREERTGLHERQFIETRRHWFTGPTPHDTAGGVQVLNLVEGQQAVVESPSDAFAPFVVHYAETFIVPAAVGRYTVRPDGPSVGTQCATIKAFVRTRA
jgi:mannose-6-phosphate isomerase class I